jgi:hypothetical protein
MFKRMLAKMRGYKTLAFNAMIGGSASVGLLLEEIKEIDLTPWFGQYAAKVLVGVAVVGIVLRLTSNTPAAGRRRRRDDYDDEVVGDDLLDDEDDGDTGRDYEKPRTSRRKGRRSARPIEE